MEARHRQASVLRARDSAGGCWGGLLLPLWPGLLGLSYVPPDPGSVSCSLCFSAQGTLGLPRAGWCRTAAGYNLVSMVSCFCPLQLGGLSEEGSLGSGGGVGGQGHSGLSVHPWLERLVPKKEK